MLKIATTPFGAALARTPILRHRAGMRTLSLIAASIFATFAIVFVVMMIIVADYAPSWQMAVVALMALGFAATAFVIYWLVDIRDVLARRS